MGNTAGSSDKFLVEQEAIGPAKCDKWLLASGRSDARTDS